MKTYDGPGRGRKQCPKCNVYLHVRSKECACGHKFVKKEAPKTQPPPVNKPVIKPEDEDRADKIRLKGNILVPAGPTPQKLSFDSIRSWVENCIVKYNEQNSGYVLTCNAVEYFAQREVGITDPKLEKVKQEIRKFYPEVMKKVAHKLTVTVF